MKSDAEIRDDVINELHWDPQVTEPEALAGEVDYDYQKREVERMANHVRGVAGVQNFIIVRPPASPEAVEAAIEQAFRRETEVNARHVKVEVTDHTAKLYGHGHSMRAASAAAAGAGPGAAAARSGGRRQDMRPGLLSPRSYLNRSRWLVSSRRSGQVAWPAAGSARISSPSRSSW